MPDGAHARDRDRIQSGDRVVLFATDGERFLLVAGSDPQRVRGLGVVAPANLVGKPWGAQHAVGNRTFILDRPGYRDIAETIERKAQIILPKDASRILFECDIRAGSRVVEAGVGSGALTSALAFATRPGGLVTVYELRDDFAAHARANWDRAGISEGIALKIGDVAKDVTETNVDAFVIDIPNPADAVPAAERSLRPDGHFAAYTPLVTQMEAVSRELLDQGFHDVRSFELLERAWHVGPTGSRPQHEVLGHTAFLTFARRTGTA
ncbi:MAG: tRNA (adenine-N1)-methyltransferase [Thermoplasmatota archaeon]